MEEFTYEQIRTKALKKGIRDNRLQIGMWAQFNGYMKYKKQINGKAYQGGKEPSAIIDPDLL